MAGQHESWTTMRVALLEEARMRGDEDGQADVWSYIPLEQRVPADHPLRPMRAMVDAILVELSPQFNQLYSRVGRPSIPPDLLFRWFVGLKADGRIWDATVFTKNRQRLLDGEIARAFFDRVVAQARERGLLSDEHFTVDGTLIEAWASLKSFKPTGAPPTPPDDPGNPTVNFHGERRSNATHASTTDPEARLFRKGDSHEAKLYYQGHVLMENRHGLAVDGSLTPATGFAEREQALAMATQLPTGATLGADKSYDTRDFVDGLRGLAVTPHVAQHTTKRSSAIDGRTTRHGGYLVSQRQRKRIEEIFGWRKQIGLLRKTRYRGVARVSWMFTFGLAVYNLVRMRNLASQAI